MDRKLKFWTRALMVVLLLSFPGHSEPPEGLEDPQQGRGEKVKDIRGLRLHSKRQLVTTDAGLKLVIALLQRRSVELVLWFEDLTRRCLSVRVR